MANFGLAGIRIFMQESGGGENHSRRAETALQAVLFPKRFLNRMQRATAHGGMAGRCCGAVRLRASGKAFDGGDVRAVGLDGEHGAGLHSFAVEENGARTADAGFAADMRAGEAQRVAEIMNKEEAGLDGAFVVLSVHAKANFRSCGSHRTSCDVSGKRARGAGVESYSPAVKNSRCGARERARV